MLGGIHCLGHQHLKAAHRLDAVLLGAQQQFGAEGIVDYIQHRFQLGEGRGVQHALPHVGEHAAGGGVDDDLHVPAAHGLVVGQRAELAGAAGRQDGLAPLSRQNRLHGGVGAAGAEDQHGFVGKIHAMHLGQIGKAQVIGVVAIELAIPVDDGVDGPDGLGLGVQHIAVGDDQLFVGNGHIDGRKGALLHEGAGLRLGGQGNQFVPVGRPAVHE